MQESFGMFYSSKSILNQNSFDRRALKIHVNDTKIDRIPWDSQVENHSFLHLRGRLRGWVGGSN